MAAGRHPDQAVDWLDRITRVAEAGTTPDGLSKLPPVATLAVLNQGYNPPSGDCTDCPTPVACFTIAHYV